MSNNSIRRIKNIYIHIPFCRRKCSFCDFSIYAIGSKKDNKQQFDDTLSNDYVDNLIKEIDFIGTNYKDNFVTHENLESIYFGGGTPTLLQAKLIEKILNSLSKYFVFSNKHTEISIESDPNTFDLSQLDIYSKRMPFNRLTMGAQSLDPIVFKHLNRSHTIEQTHKSIRVIKESNFNNNFGVDLIQGLPDQTPESFENDLKVMIDYDIPHLSIYMLSLEAKSSLFRKYEREYNSEKKQNEIADMFILCHKLLTENKYEHYEISNFCKNSKYSIHNNSYWDGFSNFYGFGSSASSFAFGKRFKKPKSLVKYYELINKVIENSKHFEQFLNENDDNVDDDFSSDKQFLDLKFLLLNQLRRKEGLNLVEIKNNFGVSYYNRIKEFFLNSKSKHPFVIHSFNNDLENISVKFPEGALISDELLVQLYECLEENKL